MNDSDKPKRKFWQFHLSTAILVMIASGPLLWLNCSPRRSKIFLAHWGDPARDYYADGFITGWPAPLKAVEDDGTVDAVSPIAPVTNMVAGVAILLSVGFISEWLIRRREARKT
jgi:hypothetical protein